MFCPYCGKPMEQGRFCPHCGKNLLEASPGLIEKEGALAGAAVAPPPRVLTADELLSPKAPVREQAAGSTPVSAPPPVRETEEFRPYRGDRGIASGDERRFRRGNGGTASGNEFRPYRGNGGTASGDELRPRRGNGGAALSRWGDRSRPFPASPCQGRCCVRRWPMGEAASRLPPTNRRPSLLPASPATVQRPATSL